MRIGKVTYNLEVIKGMTKAEFASIANESAMGISIDSAWEMLNPTFDVPKVVRKKGKKS